MLELKQLHWLPIKQRFNNQIAPFTWKMLLHQSPTYLADLIPHRSVTNKCSLRNNTQRDISHV